jgi:type VI secretion system secreted protein Hcp
MTRRVLRLLLPVSLMALLGLSAQAQATDYLIKISGIPGDSNAKGAEDSIVATSVNWKITRSGGRGRSTALPRLDDFTFTHRVDSASPLLLEAAATGNNIDSARFIVFTGGDSSQRVLEYCLEDVVVKSIEVNGTPANGLPVETVDLNPSSFEERVAVQNQATGALGDPVLFGWDLVNGHEIGFNDNCGADPNP